MVRAVKAIDAGVRLNPQALSSRVRGQGDELWDSFVESSNKFYDCVDRIEVACIPFEAILQRLLEIARETRLSNNPPDVFRREFVEAIQGDFQLLTGLLEPSWGPVFLGFCAAAWDSAELQAELGGERLIKDLRKIT